MATYPPSGPTISGDVVSASSFLKNPAMVARRLRELGELGYVGSMLLKGRQATSGGAVSYEQVENLFADAAPEVVAPGSEYTLTTISAGPAGVARVAKWGKDSIITDESVKRRNMDPIEKGLLKLTNSAAVAIDSAVLSVIASAITNTAGVSSGAWTAAATTTILQDIMLAQAAIANAQMGYVADTLVVSHQVWAHLASNATIAAAMARETRENPVYSGRFSILAGLEVVHVPAGNLPGGVGTNAWVLDSRQLGFIATEDLGGGYQSAGDLVESKVMRVEENDAWRIRARANFVPVVTDPGAGVKITGVSA